MADRASSRPGSTRVLAVAEDADGGRAEVRARGPEAHVFTARATAGIVARVANDGAIPGFQTPPRASGPKLLRWRQRWLEGLVRMASLGSPDDVTNSTTILGERTS